MKNLFYVALAAAFLSTACGETAKTTDSAADKTATAETGKTADKAADKPKAPMIKAGVGVDVAKKTIFVGTLNDESGPAAVIGKPFAVGKRLMAAQANDPKNKMLPAGWKIELVERDHGYNPGKSQQEFAAIKDKVLFVGTSFGTPPTMPLRPFLKKENIIAFPASLSSQMAEFEQTPPIGAPYTAEAQRAMDWAVSKAGGADKVKAGIIYDQNDYGKDGHSGWTKAAAAHGVTIVATKAIKPGQKDFTAEVAALKAAGANYVLLTVLPSASGVILGTAAKMQYGPTWIGNTASWVDPFFKHPKLPAPVFANFYWVTGLPFWGEKVPGMDKFLAGFAAYSKSLSTPQRPDFYVLTSYIQGLVAVEALNRSIKAGDLTREGFYKQLRTIKGFDAGGLTQPMDLTKFPYVTSTKTRILKPDFAKTTWTVVADYAEPGAKPAAAPPAAAPAAAPKGATK